MKTVRLPFDSLHPDPENTNTHNERNIEVIKNSLRQWGQYRAFVVQKHSEALGLEHVIVVGNGMYQAMTELGTFDTVAVEIRDLPDTERRALSIQDNKSSDLSEVDRDKLGDILRNLPVEDVLLTGFDKAELAEFDIRLDGELWGPGKDEDDQNVPGDADNIDVSFRVIVDCEDEQHQVELLERFEKEGLKCQALML